MAVPDASFAPPQAALATQFTAPPQVASAPSAGQGLALDPTGAIPSGLAGPPAVTGQIDSSGNNVAGTGFTPSTTGTGAYTVTFDSPFASPPTVVATAIGGNRIVRIVTVSTTVVTLLIANDAGSSTNSAFHFVAFATV